MFQKKNIPHKSGSNVNGTLIVRAVVTVARIFHAHFIVDEETSKRKLVEAMKRFAGVAVEIERIGRRISNAIRIDWIEIRCVRWRTDFRYVRCLLLAQIRFEIDTLEE